MNYATYASRVAAEVREEREKELAGLRLGMVKFFNKITLETRTLYCYKGIRSTPFTVPDGTYGLCKDSQTIEQARESFRNIIKGWKEVGFERVA